MLNLLINSSNLYAYSFVFSVCMLCNVQIVTLMVFPFKSLLLLYPFFPYAVQDNTVVEQKYNFSCVPYLRGKSFSISLMSIFFCIRFVIVNYKQVLNRMKFCFVAFKDDHILFSPFSINVMSYIDHVLNVKIDSYSWNKCNLIAVNMYFYILLDSAVHILFKIFAFISMKKFSGRSICNFSLQCLCQILISRFW